MDLQLSPSSVLAFVQRNPKRGPKLLSQINRLRKFSDVLESEVGSLLLTDLNEMMENRLSKLVNWGGMERQDGSVPCPFCQGTVPAGFVKLSAEYAVLSELAIRWTQRIKTLQDNVNTVKSQGGNHAG
jgi:hypothetical protein